MTTFPSEPKLKRNKKCLVCNGERKMAVPQRGVDPKIYERDPFCSAVCAKTYWGVKDSATVSVNPSKHRGKGIRLKRSKHA